MKNNMPPCKNKRKVFHHESSTTSPVPINNTKWIEGIYGNYHVNEILELLAHVSDEAIIWVEERDNRNDDRDSHIGCRVEELDSQQCGIIIDEHHKYAPYYHYVMLGDDII